VVKTARDFCLISPPERSRKNKDGHPVPLETPLIEYSTISDYIAPLTDNQCGVPTMPPSCVQHAQRLTRHKVPLGIILPLSSKDIQSPHSAYSVAPTGLLYIILLVQSAKVKGMNCCRAQSVSMAIRRITDWERYTRNRLPRNACRLPLPVLAEARAKGG